MVNHKQVKMSFWKDVYLASIRNGSSPTTAKAQADRAVRDLESTFLKEE